MIQQRVLVAGASGYLGRFVVKELKERGYWVRALARQPERLKVTGPFLEPAAYDLADEIFTGQLTMPDTLSGLCDGIDVVFSSVGITRQKEKLSHLDVDYQANRKLLELALRASVQKFIFVHIFDAPALDVMDSVRAKQLFVTALHASGMNHTVVCPNGFFSDMSEFLRMAESGRVFLIGDGSKKINPIHGADLAKVCADAISTDRKEISAGGPKVYTYQQIGEAAFSAVGIPPHIYHVPVWMVSLIRGVLHPFSRKLSEIIAGLLQLTQRDCVAPATGVHTLEEHYRALLTARRKV